MWFVRLDNIPSEYKPQADSFLPAGEYESDETSCTLLVDGEWSARDMGDLPRKFTQIYSILYGNKVRKTDKYTSRPWKGDGFSAMHFYDEARKNIPERHRPSLRKMSLASPGFMRFGLHGPTGKQVLDCVRAYHDNNEMLGQAASELDDYVREHELNKQAHDYAGWRRHSRTLNRMTRKLLEGFPMIDVDQLMTSIPGSFEAAKFAHGFYRRVKELASFEKKGMLHVPRVSRD